jgi:hypothetical protein
MKKLICTFCALVCAAILFSCQKQNATSQQTPPPNQTTPPSGPQVNSVAPSHGGDSALVTFKGVQFGTDGGDSIYFNGKLAKIMSANDTVLVAMVPTLAGTGPVTVHAYGEVLAGGTFTYDTAYKVILEADSLQGPWYIALDNNENIFVTTYGDFRIHSITPKGAVDTLRTLAGSNGIARDAAGNFYFSVLESSPGPFIIKLSPSGVLDTLATDPGVSFGQVALDKNGNVFVTNDATSTVDKISPAGVVTKIGSGFNHPSGVVVADDGTIFVTHYTTPDYNPANGAISKISPLGQVGIFAHITYDGESGLALDASNNLFVTIFDQWAVVGWVSRVSPNGTVTRLTSSNLLFPTGIALGKNGAIYVDELSDQSPSTLDGGLYKLTPH